MNNNTFIDVDNSKFANSLRFVKNDYEDEFNSIFQPNDDNIKANLPYKIIKPKAGCVVKTFMVVDDKKLFINICQDDGIPEPDDINENELREILESDVPSSFRVPMSITDLRETSVKSGSVASVLDIAINPLFFLKFQKIQLFQNFFLNLIFEAVEQKFNISLKTDKCLILRNRTVIGSLVSHRIENRDVKKVRDSIMSTSATGKRKSALIEEVVQPLRNNKITSEFSGKSDANNNLPKLREPDHRLLREFISDTELSPYIIVEFYLPDVLTANEICLEYNSDRIILEVPKRGYYFDGYHAFYIDKEKTDVEFNVMHRVLTLKMPFRQL